MMKKIGLGATAVALSLGMATAGIAPANAANITLPIGGATFQGDFQSKCITAFNAQKASLRTIGGDVVSMGGYDGVGSGNGRTGLGNGTYKIAATDSFGTKTGLDADQSVYIPAVAAPLAIFVNLKSTTNSKITSLNLSPQVLSDIMKGTVDTWNHSSITGLNRSLKLPNQAITVVTRSDSSGSTGNLKNYLNQNSTNAFGTAETATGFAIEQQGSGAPALVAKVVSTPGSIGYADLSDAVGVTLVSIQNKAGAFVKPSATAAATYVKAAGVLTPKVDSTITTNGGIYNVNFAVNVKNAYQISFISYMIGKKGLATNTQAKVYLNYMLNKCSPSPSSVRASSFTSVGTSLLTVAKAQVLKLNAS
jgi:phosphate transport system substrate-binding protein